MKHYKAVDRYKVTELDMYLPISGEFFTDINNIPKFDVLDPDTGVRHEAVLVKKCKATDSGEKLKITEDITVHYDPI